ncbi:MAG: HAMP domain-containing sensor histidine kinase [Campylobacterota bacterium]|nr:HAMP domain-containing sensor histidine kinase [Campylobacterota bacterium]
MENWSDNDKLHLMESAFLLTNDIIIISQAGKKLINVNNTFFEFFDQFESLDKFHENYKCICELFEPVDNEEYIYRHGDITSDNWMKYIINSQNKVLKAKIIKDADEYIFNVRISVLNKPDSTYIITMSDITYLEQKNLLLNEIVKSQKQYSRLKKEYEYKEKMSDFIFNAQKELLILTDGHQLKDTNKAMIDFFGYDSVDDFHTRHECICEFFEKGKDLLQKEDSEGNSWLDILRSNMEHFAKVKMKDHAGVVHTFKVSTSAMKIEGDIYLTTFSDITELIKKENMLIYQSRKAVMGNMIDSIAHQWKQPLNLIQMNISLLELKIHTNDISKQILSKSLEDITTQVEHMEQTIDQFRDFFRPYNKMETIDINELIKSVLFLVNDDLKKHHINIDLICQEQLKIEAVPNELKHVFINLINNSKDAFNNHKEKINKIITIKIKKVDNLINIYVQDNAGGIPEEIYDYIFNENFTTKEETKGSGIGLYMSKVIVEKSGGNIMVCNKQEGAMFKITFKAYD